MPSDDVTCIPATIADLPALGAWMHSFYAEEHLGSPSQAALEALLRDAALGFACIVHTPDGPAGYFLLTWGYSLERGGKIALLDELFILPGFRNRGIGRQAVAAAASLAREAECRALLLEVDRENQAAQRLYRRAGFASPGRDILALSLPPPAPPTGLTPPPCVPCYSTVTLLARFRGLSTLQPRETAAW